MIIIRHSPEEGTIVDGTARGDGSAEILKRSGFRWSRSLGAWYVQGSRDRAARTYVINPAAERLREAGFEVDVLIDDSHRPTAEREAARAERIAERQDALDAKAARKAEESDARHNQYRGIADHIPLGQPILVGHHSEGQHRRDLQRMDRHFDASVEADRAAQEAERKADASRASESFRNSVPATLRRVDRLETSLRDIERKLNGTSRNGMSYGTKATGGHRERLEAERARLVEEIAHWRQHVADAGEKVWGPSDFTKGDRVKLDGHDWGTVVRVNPKSLTVALDIWPENPLRSHYNKVRERKPVADAAPRGRTTTGRQRLIGREFSPKPNTSGARITWKHVYPDGHTLERAGEVWCLAPTMRNAGLRDTVWVIPDEALPSDLHNVIPAGTLFRDFTSYERATCQWNAPRSPKDVREGDVIGDNLTTSPLGVVAMTAWRHATSVRAENPAAAPVENQEEGSNAPPIVPTAQNTSTEITDLDTAISYSQETARYTDTVVATLADIAAQLGAAWQGLNDEAATYEQAKVNLVDEGFGPKAIDSFDTAAEALYAAAEALDNANGTVSSASEQVATAGGQMRGAVSVFSEQLAISENIGAARQAAGVSKRTDFYAPA